jgi:hypothetical protein
MAGGFQAPLVNFSGHQSLHPQVLSPINWMHSNLGNPHFSTAWRWKRTPQKWHLYWFPTPSSVQAMAVWSSWPMTHSDAASVCQMTDILPPALDQTIALNPLHIKQTAMDGDTRKESWSWRFSCDGPRQKEIQARSPIHQMRPAEGG